MAPNFTGERPCAAEYLATAQNSIPNEIKNRSKNREEERRRGESQTIGVEELEASLSKPIAEVVDGLCSDGVAFFELGDRHYRVSDLAFSVGRSKGIREREGGGV